jgi:hypothetical protein
MNIYVIVTKENDFECGVREYSKLLVDNFNSVSFKSELIELENYNFKNLINLSKRIEKKSKVIIQYPTKSMGYSIAFLFLPWILRKNNLFIFLHEFVIFSLYRKLLLSFSCFFCTFAFTNRIEANQFQKFFFWKKIKRTVIPLPSNIPYRKNNMEQKKELICCFFGHIREDFKNIEFFLKIIDELKKFNPKIKIQIFGSVFIKSKVKKDNLFNQFSKRDIEVYEKLTPQELSSKLNKVKVAILPLKEGLSEKKATAFACLEHQMAVFSNHSKLTPRWLRLLTHPMNDLGIDEIAREVIQTMELNDNELKLNHDMLESFLQIHSWNNVMDGYFQLLSSDQHQ